MKKKGAKSKHKKKSSQCDMKHPGDSNRPIVLNRPNIIRPECDWQNDSVMRFEIKPTVDV